MKLSQVLDNEFTLFFPVSVEIEGSDAELLRCDEIEETMVSDMNHFLRLYVKNLTYL